MGGEGLLPSDQQYCQSLMTSYEIMPKIPPPPPTAMSKTQVNYLFELSKRTPLQSAVARHFLISSIRSLPLQKSTIHVVANVMICFTHVFIS